MSVADLLCVHRVEAEVVDDEDVASEQVPELLLVLAGAPGTPVVWR